MKMQPTMTVFLHINDEVPTVHPQSDGKVSISYGVGTALICYDADAAARLLAACEVALQAFDRLAAERAQEAADARRELAEGR